YENTCEWAGSSLLSNVHDLVKFGNSMLFSYLTSDGFLRQETVRSFWTKNAVKNHFVAYGLGWKLNFKRKTRNNHHNNNHMNRQRNSMTTTYDDLFHEMPDRVGHSGKKIFVF